MQYIRNYTKVPNSVFEHLNLSEKELKVLLVVVRQVLGWKDPNTGRTKERDWISQRYYCMRTGLSNRSVSTAIDELVQKGMIIATNRGGQELKRKEERRMQERIYYSLGPTIMKKVH